MKGKVPRHLSANGYSLEPLRIWLTSILWSIPLVATLFFSFFFRRTLPASYAPSFQTSGTLTPRCTRALQSLTSSILRSVGNIAKQHVCMLNLVIFVIRRNYALLLFFFIVISCIFGHRHLSFFLFFAGQCQTLTYKGRWKAVLYQAYK